MPTLITDRMRSQSLARGPEAEARDTPVTEEAFNRVAPRLPPSTGDAVPRTLQLKGFDDPVRTYRSSLVRG